LEQERLVESGTDFLRCGKPGQGGANPDGSDDASGGDPSEADTRAPDAANAARYPVSGYPSAISAAAARQNLHYVKSWRSPGIH